MPISPRKAVAVDWLHSVGLSRYGYNSLKQ